MRVRSAFDRVTGERAGAVALGFIVLLALVAVFGPGVIDRDPSAISRSVLQPPSGSAWLGTDHLGRDMLTRIVIGARVSLVVGLLAAGMAGILGVTVGAIAGYFGRGVDLLLMRVSEIFQVMPTVIIGVAIVALVGAGLVNIIIVIAVLSWARTARVMRAEVLRVKELPYVDAVRCLGYDELILLLREVVPNALPAIIPLISLGVAEAILQESSISFLGLGSPDMVSWGLLLNDGLKNLLRAWWMTIFPGAAVFMTVLAFNILGDAVGALLNPRRVRA